MAATDWHWSADSKFVQIHADGASVDTDAIDASFRLEAQVDTESVRLHSETLGRVW
jgi:hypothetical protein